MKNISFEDAQKFINSIVELLKTTLDKDTIDSVLHYLRYGEYEMAFEGLFIEIMKLNEVPKIDLSKSYEVGKFLKLDENSVFDFEFWEKFNDFCIKSDKIPVR